MKQCKVCNVKFAGEDAFRIHLGVGAPAFHLCNSEEEMAAKGMTQSAGEWTIDESLVVHRNDWTYLLSKAEKYNREMDERNRIAYETREKPWLPGMED